MFVFYLHHLSRSLCSCQDAFYIACQQNKSSNTCSCVFLPRCIYIACQQNKSTNTFWKFNYVLWSTMHKMKVCLQSNWIWWQRNHSTEKLYWEPEMILGLLWLVSGCQQSALYTAQSSTQVKEMRQPSRAIRVDDDDDVGLHVLRCWVDILGTNCNSKQDLRGGTCRCFMHREDVQKYWCPEMLLLQLLVSLQHSLFNTDSSLKVAVYSGSQKDHK